MNIRFNKLVFFSVLILFGCDKTIEKKDVDTISQVNKNMKTSPSSAGRVEYFVCDDGSDANDGQTPYSPWQTYEKAMLEFNYLNEGESIRFCRGGVFYVEKSIKLFNENCTADLPCMISDYYPPNQRSSVRPVIQSPKGLTVFPFQDGGEANQDGGYIVKNLILESEVANKPAIFLHNDVDDLTIDNLKIDGFRIGFHSARASTLAYGSNLINERIVIKNSQLINNFEFGWLGGCSECEIDSNVFENNGYKGRIYYHNIYFSGKKVASENVVISNNTLKKSAIINGKCAGVSLVVHGVVENIRIENNLIEEELGKVEPGCWGISLDPGWKTEEKFQNVIIKGNTLINTGNVAIGCASCVNVQIESNVILNVQDFHFVGVKIPVRKEDSVKSSNIIVRDNTINLTRISDSSMLKNEHIPKRRAAIKPKIGISITKKELGVIIEDNKFYSNRNDFNCIVIENEKYDDIDSCQLFDF